jgi:hypothetical protein
VNVEGSFVNSRESCVESRRSLIDEASQLCIQQAWISVTVTARKLMVMTMRAQLKS